RILRIPSRLGGQRHGKQGEQSNQPKAFHGGIVSHSLETGAAVVNRPISLIKPFYRRFRGFAACSPSNTRAKIRSIFLSCRFRSNARSTCRFGTLPVIFLSLSTNCRKFRPFFHARMA